MVPVLYRSLSQGRTGLTMLTDTDIKRALGRHIWIQPYNEDNLTPVGYDFSVADFVYSLQSGPIEPINSLYEILPGETVLILTKELLWVSKRIGGSFHSKVSLVSKGFSHISTTLDPDWSGRLLIAMTNQSKQKLNLHEGETFVTLILFYTRSMATKRHNKPERRRDILLELMKSLVQPNSWQKETEAALKVNNDRMIAKFMDIFKDSETQHRFEQQVRELEHNPFLRDLRHRRTRLLGLAWRHSISLLSWVALILLLTLPLYFTTLTSLKYDTQVAGAQIVGVLTLFLFMTRMSRL